MSLLLCTLVVGLSPQTSATYTVQSNGDYKVTVLSGTTRRVLPQVELFSLPRTEKTSASISAREVRIGGRLFRATGLGILDTQTGTKLEVKRAKDAEPQSSA